MHLSLPLALGVVTLATASAAAHGPPTGRHCDHPTGRHCDHPAWRDCDHPAWRDPTRHTAHHDAPVSRLLAPDRLGITAREGGLPAPRRCPTKGHRAQGDHGDTHLLDTAALMGNHTPERKDRR